MDLRNHIQKLSIGNYSRYYLVILIFLLVSFFLFPSLILAANKQHFIVVINQVRGNECCEVGSFEALQKQIITAKKLQLETTFAVRYDALMNNKTVALLQEAGQSNQEIGALLEITPKLASDSGVLYNGDIEHWADAQTVFLIGYSQADRIKIIDQYMKKFHGTFGFFPKTSVAWMIDSYSLQYLKEKYGITSNEITREQWGTDSYTEHGGPPHYPYQPSDNWAMVPVATNSGKLPYILRQTIADPVENYGDYTSTHTSQPNDYQKGKVGFDYFQFLFYQAHQQPTETYTFSLLGLENSMNSPTQDEFVKQLTFVADWVKGSADRRVLKASDFAQWMSIHNPNGIEVYQGETRDDENSKAWWLTSAAYRIRLRLSKGTLFISDIRLYDPNEQDPYWQQPAKRLGYWIVPFLLDGSRFYDNSTTFNSDESVPDTLTNRKRQSQLPERVELLSNLSPSDAKNISVDRQGDNVIIQNGTTPLLSLTPTSFTFASTPVFYLDNFSLNPIMQFSAKPFIWNWKTSDGQVAWGCGESTTPTCTPTVNAKLLQIERQQQYPYLFPELVERNLDASKSYVVVNNRYAIAGRNPIRLVFFPKDSFGYPVKLTENPTITTVPSVLDTEVYPQQSGNGMFFMDVLNAVPQQTQVTIHSGSYKTSVTVFFTPDCRHQIGECLRSPQYILWYVHSLIDDRVRQYQQAR